MSTRSGRKESPSYRPDVICPVRPIKLPAPVPLVPASQRPLNQQDWFHGAIPRQETQALLSREGDFLVRESHGKPGEYVLSVMASGQCRHFIIQFLNNKYQFDSEGSSFSTIPLLINHHLKRRAVLTKKSQIIIRTAITKVSLGW
ncbi:hypothetical protein NDU88_001410 [Pleurodeles waltl]|uniref:SH2 domain-containing protein n=1 Tax=Pleurodeles waltl TaxID=8319 RepID=A0AAV7KSV4_PLEWA|nr:hypothetical protein NDU88_001410 [Pleurodeles waltl]